MRNVAKPGLLIDEVFIQYQIGNEHANIIIAFSFLFFRPHDAISLPLLSDDSGGLRAKTGHKDRTLAWLPQGAKIAQIIFNKTIKAKWDLVDGCLPLLDLGSYLLEPRSSSLLASKESLEKIISYFEIIMNAFGVSMGIRIVFKSVIEPYNF